MSCEHCQYVEQNNPFLWQLKRCKYRASWKYNFTAFQSNMTSLLWVIERWGETSASRCRPPVSRLSQTEHRQKDGVLSPSEVILCGFYVSVPALSIHLNHILTHRTSCPGFLSSVSCPASGLTSWPSVKIHKSQRSVRIACLCWLGNAGPTTHPDLWAQNLKTKEIKIKTAPPH